MVNRELIFPALSATTKEDVITFLADKLLKAGKVRDTFCEAVIQREQVYPTGLQLGNLCIAMPHTFAAHVIEPTLCVAKLEKPVQFSEMGSPESILDVELVTMMAISNPQEQIGLLRKIVTLFADEEMQERLKGSNTVDDLFETLRYIDED